MTSSTNKLRFAFAFTLMVMGTVAAPRASASSVTEPYTVFYGKVLGTASVQDFLITTGKLVWAIQRADGEVVTLQTTLHPLNDRMYSYRLDVPHSAISLGLEPAAGGVPLPPLPTVHVHASVTVDGQDASLLGPAASTFTTDQLLRTATYRMDLGLNRIAVDTDGDGLPDWWEEEHGLDKQNPGDASTDFTGDGLSALDAYLQGLDPHRDSRHPSLLTGEIIVYPAGSTAVLLETTDLDSAPPQLVYTLTAPPPAGTLTLRNAFTNPSAPDVVLGAGDTFTQADLWAGRLVYDHVDAAADPGSFGVEVRDENTGHPADAGDVLLLTYQPPALVPVDLSTLEAQRIDHHFLADAGYVVMDGSHLSPGQTLSSPSAGLLDAALDAYIASYGPDRPYAMASDGGADSLLIGSHRNDMLVAGENGTLLGGAGDDWFVFSRFERGRVTLGDFTASSLDVIDLTRFSPGLPGWANQFLRLHNAGGVYEIQTAAYGAGFTNLAVVVPGLSASDADVYALVAAGRIRLGDLQLEPRMSVVASQPQASENGPAPGRFTLTREGSLAGDLTVTLTFSGTAQNGIDYVQVPSTVILPDGQTSVDVVITPYADGNTEPVEFVHLTVNPGTGYRVSAASQATVTIEDLLMLVEIDVLEPVADKEAGTPAVILISRRDVINQSVLIRFTLGGTAVNGVDYNTVSAFYNMPANETTHLLTITPKPTATLAGGMETVTVTLQTNASYRITGTARAEVAIIERMDSFAGWRVREFPGAEGDVTGFALEDSGSVGVSHFQRYAFGLDPHQPDLSGLPQVMIDQGKLVVSFRKPPGVTDVDYRVRGSANLTDWPGYEVAAEPIPAPPGAADPARVYYQTEVDGETSFIVLEAELMP